MKKTSALALAIVLPSALLVGAFAPFAAAHAPHAPRTSAKAKADDPDPQFDSDPVNAVPGHYLVTFADGLDDDAPYTPETTDGGTTTPPAARRRPPARRAAARRA